MEPAGVDAGAVVVIVNAGLDEEGCADAAVVNSRGTKLSRGSLPPCNSLIHSSLDRFWFALECGIQGFNLTRN